MRLSEYIKLLAPAAERIPAQGNEAIEAAVVLFGATLIMTLVLIILDNRGARKRSRDAEEIYKDVRRNLEYRDRKKD